MQSSVFGLKMRSANGPEGLATDAVGGERGRLSPLSACRKLVLLLLATAGAVGCASDAGRPPGGESEPDASAGSAGTTASGNSAGKSSAGGGGGGANVGNAGKGEGGGSSAGKASGGAGGDDDPGQQEDGGPDDDEAGGTSQTRTGRGGAAGKGGGSSRVDGGRRDASTGAGGAQVEEEEDAGPLLEGACRPNLVFDLPLKTGAQPTANPLGRSAVCIAIKGALLDWGCTAEANARHITCNGKPIRCADTGGVTHDKVFPEPLSDDYRYFYVAPFVVTGDGSANVGFTGGIWWVPDNNPPPPRPEPTPEPVPEPVPEAGPD